MDLADITVVVLTKDEAARIGDCLASVPAGTSALVYDSSSKDGTAQIAAERGARVVDAPWHGFAQTRVDAAALVATPWTFMLDADERITPELALELSSLDPPTEVVAYSVPRRNHFCGAWVRGAGWWPDRLVRLFRTGQVRIETRNDGEASLHETWVALGPHADLQSPIDHYSYPDLHSYSAKFARYTDIEASGAKPDPIALVAASSIMPLRALWLYFGRGAIADGWRGAYIAWCSALYPVAVAAKAFRASAGRQQ